MDVTSMRKSLGEFLAVAEGGGFGPPPAGEWEAEPILAHAASALASGSAAALAFASGQRLVYDNRVSLDEWNLQRIVAEAGGLASLAGLVRRYGELLCEVAAGCPVVTWAALTTRAGRSSSGASPRRPAASREDVPDLGSSPSGR